MKPDHIGRRRIRHLAILKATNLGVTELMLRIMVWLCVRDDSLSGSSMVVLVGPTISLAVGLMRRLKSF